MEQGVWINAGLTIGVRLVVTVASQMWKSGVLVSGLAASVLSSGQKTRFRWHPAPKATEKTAVPFAMCCAHFSPCISSVVRRAKYGGNMVPPGVAPKVRGKARAFHFWVWARGHRSPAGRSDSFSAVITCFSFPQGLNCTVKNSKSRFSLFLSCPDVALTPYWVDQGPSPQWEDP